MCNIAHGRHKIYKDDEKKEEIDDYSWLAPEGLSCWQKAHEYYIPQVIFDRNPVPIASESPIGQKPRFQKSNVSSELYTKKRIAFGLDKVQRGRKKQTSIKIPLEQLEESHIEESHNIQQPTSPCQSLQLSQVMDLEDAHVQAL